MKLSLLIGFLPVAALSVGMEQIVVEEPGRTNRSAQAWADAAQPGRLAATMPYVDSIAVTSTYPAGLVYVPAALAAGTERFSTNWSYSFRPGGGVVVDTSVVRDSLTIDASPISIPFFDTRFLLVTNSGVYGAVDIDGDVSIRGPVSTGVMSGAQASSSVATVAVDVVNTAVLGGVGGPLVFDAPVVYVKGGLAYQELVGSGGPTGSPPTSVVSDVGLLGFAEYDRGLLDLVHRRTPMSPYADQYFPSHREWDALYEQHAALGNEASGVSADFSNLFWLTGPTNVMRFNRTFKPDTPLVPDDAAPPGFLSRELRWVGLEGTGAKFEGVPASWANVPVLCTWHNVSDLGFAATWWKYSRADMVLAGPAFTNAVDFIFANAPAGGLWYYSSKTGVDKVTVTRASALAAGVTYANAASIVLGTLRHARELEMDAAVANAEDWAAFQANFGLPVDIGRLPEGMWEAVLALCDAVVVSANEMVVEGMVPLAYARSSGSVSFKAYRQFKPDPARRRLYRVTVQLWFTEPPNLGTKAARYWLTMNGRRLLARRLSANGETGAAFALIDSGASAPGYLYLDLSEFERVFGRELLLKSGYYVKIEELRGITPWQTSGN